MKFYFVITLTLLSLFQNSSNIPQNCFSTNSINFTQPSIRVNSLNGISLTSVFGITEIVNDANCIIFTDWSNDRGN
jgi:hypothetical protein